MNLQLNDNFFVLRLNRAVRVRARGRRTFTRYLSTVTNTLPVPQ